MSGVQKSTGKINDDLKMTYGMDRVRAGVGVLEIDCVIEVTAQYAGFLTGTAPFDEDTPALRVPVARFYDE